MALFSVLALTGCGSSSNSASDQLSSLTISSGTLSPTFVSGTADYTASVDSSVTMVTVTPTAKDSSATITVNDVAVTSGAASESINLDVGDTAITITVTGKNGGATYTYTITVTRAAIGTGGIGSPCQCTASGCTIAGVPFPPGGSSADITGCENAATNIPTGAELLCLRSYDGGTTIPSTYFANGYCSLGATSCSGNSFCSISTFGSFSSMTSCPTGSVMITDTTPTAGTILAGATLETKVCAKSCSQPSDCRTTETDSEFGGATTQYQCSAFNSPDKCNGNTTTFCYDPRNLSSACVVTPGQ